MTDRIESDHDEEIHGRRDAASAPSRQSTDPARKSRVRPRIPDFDYTGRYAYHLEVNTNHRRPVLTGAVADAIIADLARAADATSFELMAYMVMPDHVHILALGVSDEANALSFMQRFKQLTGYRFARDHPKPFWQQSFFDRALRRDEDLLPIARYIFGNPIEAGLIAPGGEWPHQGGTLMAGVQTNEGTEIAASGASREGRS